jgi:hypothetical protein
MTAPDTLPPELQELGDLLLEDPPRPDPGWARELDARAAAGFPRPPRRSPWRAFRPFLLPSLGFAATVLLVVGIASMDMGSDQSGDSASSSGGGASSGAGSEGDASRASGGEDSGFSAAQPQADDSGSSAELERHSLTPTARDGDPGSDSRRTRRVERTAALTLAARPRQIEDVADGVVRVTDAAGGYVASSSVSGGDAAGGSFRLRIPTARLQRAIADLSRLAHVRERTQQTNDITAQSVSARERLREARREREGLLRALARAVTLNETESIKARLRIVNRQIGVARAAVGRIDNRARFANVEVTLIADRDAGGPGSDDGGTWTPGDALDDALRVLEVAAGVAVIALALLLPLGLIAALGIAAGRIAGRRRRERALDMA